MTLHGPQTPRFARPAAGDAATAELFGRVVGDGGLNKVAWGEAMGKVVTTRPGRNRSPSFNALLRGLLELRPAASPPKRAVAYRHPPKDRRDVGKRR
jgi:hypothetical protein